MQVASYYTKAKKGDKLDTISSRIRNQIGLRMYPFGSKSMIINNTDSITTKGMGGDLHLYNLKSGEYKYAKPNNFYKFKSKGDILEVPIPKGEGGMVQSSNPFTTTFPKLDNPFDKQFGTSSIKAPEMPKMDLTKKTTANPLTSGKGISSGTMGAIGMGANLVGGLIPSNVKDVNASKFVVKSDYDAAMNKVQKKKSAEDLQKTAESAAMSSGNPYAMAGAGVSMLGRAAESAIGSTTDEYGIEEYGTDAAIKKTAKDIINPVGNITEAFTDPSAKNISKALLGSVGSIAVNAFGIGKRKDRKKREELKRKADALANSNVNRQTATMYNSMGRKGMLLKAKRGGVISSAQIPFNKQNENTVWALNNKDKISDQGFLKWLKEYEIHVNQSTLKPYYEEWLINDKPIPDSEPLQLDLYLKKGGILHAKQGGLLGSTEAFLPIGARHSRKHNIKKFDGQITNKGIPVGMKKGGEFEQTAEIETCELTLGEEFNTMYTEYINNPSDEDLVKIGKELYTAVKDMGRKGFKVCNIKPKK